MDKRKGTNNNLQNTTQETKDIIYVVTVHITMT
jgi:hypothetical protein